jgi:hypothetical protein
MLKGRAIQISVFVRTKENVPKCVLEDSMLLQVDFFNIIVFFTSESSILLWAS